MDRRIDMRVKSAVDRWYKTLLFSVIGVMVAAGVTLTLATEFKLQNALYLYAVILIVTAFLLWLMFGTYYELCADHLYCRSGPFVERIKYCNIKYLGLTENMLSSMALSSKRIEIRQHNKSYVTGTTMISPENREVFLERLIILCTQLDPSEH